jgi:hypothetical protein
MDTLCHSTKFSKHEICKLQQYIKQFFLYHHTIVFVNQSLYILSEWTKFLKAIHSSSTTFLSCSWPSSDGFYNIILTQISYFNNLNSLLFADKLYILLLWNKRTHRFLYTTKQPTDYTNHYGQHRVSQSKKCCINTS